MSNVLHLPEPFTASQAAAFSRLGLAIEPAIAAAKDAGVPQGLIVALLHALAHRETAEMLEQAR